MSISFFCFAKREEKSDSTLVYKTTTKLTKQLMDRAWDGDQDEMPNLFQLSTNKQIYMAMVWKWLNKMFGVKSSYSLSWWGQIYGLVINCSMQQNKGGKMILIDRWKIKLWSTCKGTYKLQGMKIRKKFVAANQFGVICSNSFNTW